MGAISAKGANMTDKRTEEIRKNYEAFRKLLPSLLEAHPGKFAVMRHAEVAQIFDTAKDAVLFAQTTYKDGLYSVQEITGKGIELGFFSLALDHATV